MLQVNFIRNNKEEVIERLLVKNFEAAEIVGSLLQLDDERRKTQKKLDDVLAESNHASRDIGALYKPGKREEAEKLKARSAERKQQARALGEKLDFATSGMNDLLVRLPNLPHASVKPGKTADDNETIHHEGTIPGLDDAALPHWDLVSRYDIVDFDLGNKVSGAGFPFYKGKGAKLQRALINFFLDRALEAGYVEYQPPLLVNEDSGFGTGQLPDKDGQMYHVTEDNLDLVPTAEVPITNIYRNVIL